MQPVGLRAQWLLGVRGAGWLGLGAEDAQLSGSQAEDKRFQSPIKDSDFHDCYDVDRSGSADGTRPTCGGRDAVGQALVLPTGGLLRVLRTWPLAPPKASDAQEPVEATRRHPRHRVRVTDRLWLTVGGGGPV